MSKVWQVKTKDSLGREVLRIFRGEELSIGSSPSNQLKLPRPSPEVLASFSLKEGRISTGIIEKGLKTTLLKKNNLQFFWNDTLFDILEIGAERRFTPMHIEKLDVRQDVEHYDSSVQTIWVFHKGRLIETASLCSETEDEDFTHLNSGIDVRLDYYTRTLLLKRLGGDLQSLRLEKFEEGFCAQSGNFTFVLTATPTQGEFSSLVDEKYARKKDNRFAPFIFTVMATWLIVVALFQFGYSPGEETILDEVLPEEMAELTIEKKVKPKSGVKGGTNGGGGTNVAHRDPRGGSGIASPDEVLVKNRQVLASAGSIMNALGSLDTVVKAGGAKMAAIGVGGKNMAQGILKALGGQMGSGGGGVGIGGIGTKGFGGGGGGGSGLGFGTKIGNGIGKGNGLRPISFESGKAVVKGGLEKSEVEAVIKQNISQIRFCYNKGLRTNPSLMGKVSSSFTINADGRVSVSRVSGSTLGAPSVEKCISSRIARWKFPEPRGGGTVNVNYPFLLKAN